LKCQLFLPYLLKRDFVKTDHTSSNPKRKKVLATGDGLNVEYFIHPFSMHTTDFYKFTRPIEIGHVLSESKTNKTFLKLVQSMIILLKYWKERKIKLENTSNKNGTKYLGKINYRNLLRDSA
jgi:hypothetical protein